MQGKSYTSLSSLPVDEHPGYSIRTAMAEFDKSAHRLKPALEPSVFRKLFGGTNSDYARTVSAACNESARITRGVVAAAARTAARMEMSTYDGERMKGRTLAGTCRRIIENLDEWRATASDFESNMHGSKKKLIELNRRMMQLIKEIDHPAAGLQ